MFKRKNANIRKVKDMIQYNLENDIDMANHWLDRFNETQDEGDLQNYYFYKGKVRAFGQLLETL